MRSSFWIALLLLGTSLACSARRDAPVRVHVDEVPEPYVLGLSNVQRTLSRLASSTPELHQRVRILFYGQSITQSGWSRTVARELRRRYPHADLQIENRAIGGFASDLLVKAAESDLYGHDADLVIFHVYGAHQPYEDIIRRLRERTTAEILIQTDHVTDEAQLDEERDPNRLAPNQGSFDAFMNYAFLPRIAQHYRATLCDQRSAWKDFLTRRKLPPAALLSDHVHLNAAGDALMAEIVLRCLRYEPELAPSPLESSVETIPVGGRGVAFHDGVLRLEFLGNRIDVVADGSGAAAVLIDGKRPSEWNELYGFTRARVNGALWPPLFDLSSLTPRRIEDWVLEVDRGAEPGAYEFELVGSKTGRDGRGDTQHRFVSKSGRVVIEPDDWNIEYAFELAGIPHVPPHFTIEFGVEPHFVDSVRGEHNDGSWQNVVTLANGLPNGAHTLELRAPAGDAPISALRVHRPLGDAARLRVLEARH